MNDNFFKNYNSKHIEIYNKVEQMRLRGLISHIVGILGESKTKKVLDLGAGTGNLSLKFLEQNCQVDAADISKNSLIYLKRLSRNNTNLKLTILNGKLLPFKKNTFDVVATYSVLHHIPDYLFTIKEMIRVTKAGGLIYIDHEANKNRYEPDQHLRQYYSNTDQTPFEHIVKLAKTGELFNSNFIRTILIKLLINKKFEREGDIHVWKDDHIEWRLIKKILKQQKCKVIEEGDYLLYRPKGGLNLFKQYKDITSDTRYLIARKNK